MEDLTELQSQETMLCAACHTENSGAAAFCKKCGYPFTGTEMEQRTFIATRDNLDIDLADMNKKIKAAGTTLIVLAVLSVISGFVFYFLNADNEQLAFVSLIIYLILAFIYVGLSIWSKKKPAAAIISGFALYILIQLLGFIENPMSVAQGIIFKILIIGYFIRGVKSALEAEKLKKEYNLD